MEWDAERTTDIDEATTARRYVFQLMLTDSLRGRESAINDVVFPLTQSSRADPATDSDLLTCEFQGGLDMTKLSIALSRRKIASDNYTSESPQHCIDSSFPPRTISHPQNGRP
jgi:hypothetical protein